MGANEKRRMSAQRHEKERSHLRTAWLRGLMLVVGLGLCLDIRVDIVQYAHMEALGIFSPEEWPGIIAGQRFLWTTRGFWAATFFYQFATWNWDRKKKYSILGDGIFFTVLALLWACLHWVIVPMNGGMRAMWLIMLAVLVCGTAYQWWKYWTFAEKEKS